MSLLPVWLPAERRDGDRRPDHPGLPGRDVRGREHTACVRPLQLATGGDPAPTSHRPEVTVPDFDVPAVQGLDLFEVYEANGSLLFVTSALDRSELDPTDVIYRRPWATAAKPTPLTPAADPEVTQ